MIMSPLHVEQACEPAVLTRTLIISDEEGVSRRGCLRFGSHDRHGVNLSAEVVTSSSPGPGS